MYVIPRDDVRILNLLYLLEDTIILEFKRILTTVSRYGAAGLL